MAPRSTTLVLALVLAAACSPGPADHYSRGQEAAKAGNWERARSEYVAAGGFQDAPQRALDALVAEAQQKEESGDLADAISLYKEAGTHDGAEEHAAELEGTKAVLDVLYSQMTASAASGEWGDALSKSAEILAIVANYRDVAKQRERYLEQAYAAASASLDKEDIADAVKLFGIVAKAQPGYRDSAIKLAEAQVDLKRPLPGAYGIDDVLRTGAWRVVLTGVVVQPDRQLVVSVKWTNESGAELTARCDNDGGNGDHAVLAFRDGTRWSPVATGCSVETGDLVPGGQAYAESATFPVLDDGTRPFRVSWYGIGTSQEIVLVHTG